jgi:tetratricopeptide (TPR) repeat protein
VKSTGLLFGLTALALAVVTCAGQGVQDPASARRAARRELDRGNPDGAVAALGARAGDSGFRYLLGAAAADRGQVARADSLLAAAGRGEDRWLAGARRAELLLAVGRRAEALEVAEAVATGLESNQANRPDDWLALGIAYRILGEDRPAQFKDALAAFDRAVAADSSLVEADLRLGHLFLDKYQGPDARAAFREALKRDPGNPRAQLGLAEVALFEGSREGSASVEKVAKDVPTLARAQALMAQMELDAERWSEAASTASLALARDSTQLEAWAIAAAAALLTGDSAAFRQIETAVQAWHRAPAGFYATIAEAVARQRRYQLAATMARRGVAAQPTDPAALTALGTNELRLGAIDSGRAHLTLAFERDPYHLWNKNTLDLLDQTAQYRPVTSGRFVIVAPPDEADLLALHLGPLLEEAFDSLAARYRFRPPTPIRLELYRHHADFSVRTVGLAGLGALGVSFGSVLAMDAPSARPPGEFNFASTAWHELTHAFTLGMTDHRVPRWLTEGLSVLEERRARPGWGAQATEAFVSALKGGQLRPFSRINDGFVRPSHPGDVGFAYYQASLLCEYLESTYRFDAILALLDGYRRGLSTADAIQAATKTSVDDVSPRFDAWLRQRFAEPLKVVGALRDSVVTPSQLDAAIESGKKLQREGRTGEAIAAFEQADRWFPEMADRDSPAWYLAELYRDRGAKAKAVQYYARVARLSESHLAANRREAALWLELADPAGALAALERAIYIHPYDIATYQEAAAAATAAGAHAKAVWARKAILALHPSDRAGALYDLAVAYRNAGDRAAARREVLRALEEAPSFEKAQALLLELRRGPS